MEYMPVMYDLFSKGIKVYNTEEEGIFIETQYEKAENTSIDYGIMEKAANVYVKKASFDWNDLGTWGALHDKMTTQTSENAVVRALPRLKNAHGNVIYTSSKKLVVIEDLDDYIIVDNENVLLIYPKNKEQNIKSLVTEISNTVGKKYT
jgi:mannose-1-phosphate guanylyltransferase